MPWPRDGPRAPSGWSPDDPSRSVRSHADRPSPGRGHPARSRPIPPSPATTSKRSGDDRDREGRPGRSRARRSASSPTRRGATRSASSGTGPASSRSSSTSWPAIYGRPTWERRLDPTSELILTILTQNSADTNAEIAFERLREAYPSGLPEQVPPSGRRLGRDRAAGGRAAGLGGRRVRADPGADRRHPAGRPRQPEGAAAPGDPAPDPRGARRLLPGVPRRDVGARRAGVADRASTASARRRRRSLLLFCFGLPLMPIDRHVERVSQRVGLIPTKATVDDAHDLFLGRARARPDVRGARQPDPARPDDLPRPASRARALPAARPRCRFVDPKAP